MDVMDEILDSLGLSDEVLQTFKDNGVGPKEVLAANETEFALLGIANIGDRIKLRQKCREHIDSVSSNLPVVNKLRNMVKNRRLKSNVAKNSKEEKGKTIKVNAGWKHCDTTGGKVKQVTASNGGGTHAIELPKNSSREEILQFFLDLFFPGGRNEAKGLKMTNLRASVTTFSGKALTSFCQEQPFTLSEFCKELKSHPIRLYLVTIPQNGELYLSEDDEEDEGELPDMNINVGESLHSKVRAGATSPRETVKLPDTPTISFPHHRQEGGHDHSHDLYETYVCMLDDNDELEEDSIEIVGAGQAPVIDIEPADNTTEDLAEIYQRLVAFKTDIPLDIIVHRRRIMSSAVRATKSKDFSFWSMPLVTFSGEEAEDDGGPRREFFKLLMREVLAGGILQGAKSGMTFTHNLSLLKEQAYKTAGQFVTWSIVNGGPGLGALCPSVFAAMTGKNVDLADIENVADAETRANLIKLNKCPDPEKFHGLILELTDWLINQGVSNVIGLKLTHRDELVKDLLLHEIYYRVQPAINQFIDGLGPLWGEVKMNPTATAPLLVCNDKQLTLREMKKLYTINYSLEGSNKRLPEEDTVYSFEIFLQNCAEQSVDVSLEELLDFWTAADKVPPCGFSKPLQVDFYTSVTGIRRLPSSHTCGPVLWLPRGVLEPQDLQQMMVDAIKNCQGFGKI